MRIHDPKHVGRHRVVIISTIVGIVLVFGVWMVQLQKLFADVAEVQLTNSVDGEFPGKADYTAEVEALLPGLSESLSDVLILTEQSFQAQEARENGLNLVAEEMLSRLNGPEEEEEATEEPVVEGEEGAVAEEPVVEEVQE